jgi:amidohydrolase
MRSTLSVSFVILVSLASAAVAETRQARVAAAAESLRDSLIAQRRDFHMHPELSNREERTSRVIAERLKALGFDDIRTGVSRYGIVAVLKGGKPGGVVAVRADMDALPIEETMNVPYKSLNKGVKHACGHDVHMTVALGTAEVLSKMRAEIPGTVKFIFQPAEEGAPEGEDSGAARMVAEGALENPKPSAIFGLHTNPELPAGKIGWIAGGMLASSDSLTLRIKGQKVHAAWPHRGIDPIVIAADCILELQTIRSRRIDPVEPMVLTIGSIHGGNRHNIIADQVTLEGTLRTHNEAVREKVMALIKEIVTGVAATNGGSAEVSWGSRSIPVTYNPPELTEQVLPYLRSAVGAENVVRVAPVMGGEDFSVFQKAIPGVYYWLGVRNEQRGITGALHTAEYDADEASLVVGVKAMTNLLLDYLPASGK